jgi:tetratricopeptide (TPR) repeat protein
MKLPWSRNKGEVIDEPLALRDRLFEAIAREDARELAGLCRANRDRIRDSYPAWLTPADESLGSNPRRIEWYGRNLLAIARCFAQELGDRSLVDRLMKPGNALEDRDAKLRESVALVEAHEYEKALDLLKEAREGVRRFTGIPAKQRESFVVGYMGTCLYQGLRPEEALACYEEATELCTETEDHAGIRAYLANRIEALRYLGRHQDAVPLAERLAEALEAHGDTVGAARYRARARVMAVGEPLLRLVFHLRDRIYEQDELPTPLNGSFNVLFERNRMTLLRCGRRVEEGGKETGRNRLEEALRLFRSARELDPYAPEPDYHSASTCLLLGRYQEAIEALERVEQLAPGWFLARSELWLARQLAAGRFHSSVHGILLAFEDQSQNPKKVAEAAKELCDHFDDLPQAWLMLGEALHRLGRDEQAEAAFRKGLEHAEDSDVRTRLLLSLAMTQNPPRRAELEQAAALNGHLISGAGARVTLRSL